jgi:hypothetical protein
MAIVQKIYKIIRNQVASKKSSLLPKISIKTTFILTSLKQKLFTKVNKMPSKEAWVWIDRESN